MHFALFFFALETGLQNKWAVTRLGVDVAHFTLHLTDHL